MTTCQQLPGFFSLRSFLGFSFQNEALESRVALNNKALETSPQFLQQAPEAAVVFP